MVYARIDGYGINQDLQCLNNSSSVLVSCGFDCSIVDALTRSLLSQDRESIAGFYRHNYYKLVRASISLARRLLILAIDFGYVATL